MQLSATERPRANPPEHCRGPINQTTQTLNVLPPDLLTENCCCAARFIEDEMPGLIWRHQVVDRRGGRVCLTRLCLHRFEPQRRRCQRLMPVIGVNLGEIVVHASNQMEAIRRP